MVAEFVIRRKVHLRHSVCIVPSFGFVPNNVHRAVLSAGRRLSKPVCDGFDGIVAVADGFGAVVEGKPLAEGRVLTRFEGLAAAGDLARRNSAREVVDQTSNIRMAFVLDLPDIDVRMVLGQLQMGQERPVLADDMLTIFAVNPPRLDSGKSESTRPQNRGFGIKY